MLTFMLKGKHLKSGCIYREGADRHAHLQSLLRVLCVRMNLQLILCVVFIST